MVAASKLRRAQAAAEAARPYAERMEKVLGNIAGARRPTRLGADAAGRHRQRPGASAGRLHRRARPVRRVQLVDRAARARARQRADGARARRSRSSASAARATSSCAAQFAKQIIERVELRGVRTLGFEQCRRRSPSKIIALFEEGEFDVATLFFSRFKSVIARSRPRSRSSRRCSRRRPTTAPAAVYEYEPDEDEILAELLPRNIAVQIFRALLENAASVQGAQMSAMDNATRNAGDMIRKLTHHLQPHAPGDDHQGTDRDHLRRRGALIRFR